MIKYVSSFLFISPNAFSQPCLSSIHQKSEFTRFQKKYLYYLVCKLYISRCKIFAFLLFSFSLQFLELLLNCLFPGFETEVALSPGIISISTESSISLSSKMSGHFMKFSILSLIFFSAYPFLT